MRETAVDRYDRQQRIQDWDQSRLTAATVVIAGSGPIAFFTGLMATAMGFGRLVFFGSGGHEDCDGTFSDLVNGAPAGWTRFFQLINPKVHMYPVPGRICASKIAKLPALDLVMLCGNDPQTIRLGEEVAQTVPVIAGSAAGQVGVWGLPKLNKTTTHLARFPESALIGQIVAGLLVDEARKRLMPLKGEAGPTKGTHLFALPKLPGHARVNGIRPGNLGHELALIGAGALGTWLGIGLGVAGIRKRIDLYDPDAIDETNLNRQVLFYDAVGKPKSLVLASRLQKLFPRMKVNGYQMKAEAATAQHVGKHGLLAACPDNFAVRAYLNQMAQQGNKTLVNGGTSPFGGSCMTYAPGATPCLNCAVAVDRLAQAETEAQGCDRQVQSSVVTSNAITGGLMAWTIQQLLRGRITAGISAFDGRASGLRMGVHSVRPSCRCHGS